MLKYDTAPWGFALAVDEMRGGAGAFAGLTRSDLKDRRIMLNGYAALSPTIKLGAGLMRRDNDAAQAASASNGATPRSTLDRKSTRLNSSHSQISYAVFCLKKKTKCT